MMAADTFALLSQDHLCFLWQQNLLKTILQKVKKYEVHVNDYINTYPIPNTYS